MGDAVNVFIYPEPHSTLPIFGVIAGTAIKAGVAEPDLPSISEMAGYRAKVGTPDFYKLRAPPEHQPLIEPLELLRRLWPAARDTLAQPPQKKQRKLWELQRPFFGDANLGN
jgi:hypothetical protein